MRTAYALFCGQDLLNGTLSGLFAICVTPLIPNSLVEQRHDLIGRNRPAKKIPLRFIALVLAQESQLLFSLNPFRDDLQVQHMTQRYDSHRNRLVVRVCWNVTNEGLVNLEPTHRKLLQRAEAGIARSKVVDG